MGPPFDAARPAAPNLPAAARGAQGSVGAMTGYSGTPLPKKLGIKPESEGVVPGPAPDGFLPEVDGADADVARDLGPPAAAGPALDHELHRLLRVDGAGDPDAAPAAHLAAVEPQAEARDHVDAHGARDHRRARGAARE